MASGGYVYHVNMSYSFPATPPSPNPNNWGGVLGMVLTSYDGTSLTLVSPNSDGDYDLPAMGNLLFYLFDVTNGSTGSGTTPQSIVGSTSWLTGFQTAVNGTNLYLITDLTSGGTLPTTLGLYSVGPQSSPGIGDGTSSYPCWVVGSSNQDAWVGGINQFSATTYPNGVSFPNVTFQFTVLSNGTTYPTTTFGDDPDMIVKP